LLSQVKLVGRLTWLGEFGMQFHEFGMGSGMDFLGRGVEGLGLACVQEKLATVFVSHTKRKYDSLEVKSKPIAKVF